MKKSLIVLALATCMLLPLSSLQANAKTTPKDDSACAEIEHLTMDIESKAKAQLSIVDRNTISDEEYEKLYNEKIKENLKKSTNNTHDIKLMNAPVTNAPVKNRVKRDTSITSPPQGLVTIQIPRFYVSSQGMYVYSEAGFKYASAVQKPTCGSDVGGAYGNDIIFGGKNDILSIDRSTFYTQYKYSNSYNNYLYPEISNEKGVFYKFQDSFEDGNYNAVNRCLFVWPSFVGKGTATARTQFVHTWGGNGISSVSVSAGMFGISFDDNSNAWNGVSIGQVDIRN